MGFPDGAMVYCCFNAAQKITPAMFRCWMEILSACHTPFCGYCRPMGRPMSDCGNEPPVMIFGGSAGFRGRRPNAEHLARYPLADLFLDTSPYGAHTTASDALWMGVPVLTIAGLGFASRVCTSLVRAAGLAELVCDGPEAYEDRAVELGNDRTF